MEITGAGKAPPSKFVPNAFEALFISPEGGVLLVGWADDLVDPIDRIVITAEGWAASVDSDGLSRFRRADVEAVLKRSFPKTYGYLCLSSLKQAVKFTPTCKVEVFLQSGICISAVMTPHLLSSEQLRDVCLNYLINADFYGNRQINAVGCLEGGLGQTLLEVNRNVVRQFQSNPYVERFGSVSTDLQASIIVCLFGKAEYLFLQAALYSTIEAIEKYEFIYVCNSPELADRLLSEARIANRIYGIPITIVLLSGNAGFGAANNCAASVARSRRLVVLNPDVFPRAGDWAAKHLAIIHSSSSEGRKLFGASLFYDDGSLMHGGMHFEMDRGVTVRNERNVTWQLLRVEHYGKGTSVGANMFTQSRPVPAVTGAFISCEREWFDRLGGFSIDYVFGHYEDADLCLRSLQAGVTPWLQALELWHLEGKGSTRLPIHEGGSLVNRWLFTSKWGGIVSDGLLGPEPSHRAF